MSDPRGSGGVSSETRDPCGSDPLDVMGDLSARAPAGRIIDPVNDLDEFQKEELVMTAAIGTIVRGIHNYCDRWCERCPATSRCLVRIEELRRPVPEEPDGDESGMSLVLQSLRETHSLIESIMKEEGVEVSAEEMEEICREQTASQERVEQDVLVIRAMEYAQEASEWLRSRDSETEWDLPGDARIEDGLAVIRWYLSVIATKIHRAVESRLEADSGTSPRNPESARLMRNDADGSVKVALIGMDRSIRAWKDLIPDVALPGRDSDLIAKLEDLRKMSEDRFPRARAFLRPGLDSNYD